MDRVSEAVTDSVALSLPEVSSLALRAARGAGYPWGLCEDCGFAAAWLAERGIHWSQPLLRRLTGPRGAKVRPAPDKWASDGPICALVAGVTLADFATLPEGPGESGVTLGRVLDPVFLVPFLTFAAERTGQAYEGVNDGRPWLHVSSSGLAVAQDVSGLEVADVALRPTAAIDASHQILTPCAPEPISNETYARLDALALRMTVPATAASAKRAGASGSDND
ncbi:MAG: DUF3726 domain-containing protein [Paracoccaceae bacterium]